MVHGTNDGIQYEIILNEDIDFYDDLLPIWTLTRKQINITKNKLIIFSIYDFREQLDNTIFDDYVKNRYAVDNQDFEINFSTSFLLAYYKNYNILNDDISDTDFNNYLLQYEELKKNLHLSRDYFIESMRLFNIIISHLINKNMDKIKELEQSYYDLITLTPQQHEILEKVLTHPNLKDKIQSHGLKISHVDY